MFFVEGVDEISRALYEGSFILIDDNSGEVELLTRLGQTSDNFRNLESVNCLLIIFDFTIFKYGL